MSTAKQPSRLHLSKSAIKYINRASLCVQVVSEAKSMSSEHVCLSAVSYVRLLVAFRWPVARVCVCWSMPASLCVSVRGFDE